MSLHESIEHNACRNTQIHKYKYSGVYRPTAIHKIFLLTTGQIKTIKSDILRNIIYLLKSVPFNKYVIVDLIIGNILNHSGGSKWQVYKALHDVAKLRELLNGGHKHALDVHPEDK